VRHKRQGRAVERGGEKKNWNMVEKRNEKGERRRAKKKMK
jgi:hypothetical protein